MFYQHDTFIGVDVSTGKLPYITAVLNGSGDLLALEKCSLDGVTKYMGGYGTVVIAVNSPRFLPGSKMDDVTDPGNLLTRPSDGRIIGQRAAEYILKTRKIRFSAAPAQQKQIPSRISNGFRLYKQLDKMSSPLVEGRSIIEVNAQASFQTFLGMAPFLKSSIEGKIQRQLILLDQGVKLPDPMEYFEEVTRHRILQGILPDSILYSARQLDALAAALLARMSHQDPSATVLIGDDSDGWIVLPVGKMDCK